MSGFAQPEVENHFSILYNVSSFFSRRRNKNFDSLISEHDQKSQEDESSKIDIPASHINSQIQQIIDLYERGYHPDSGHSIIDKDGTTLVLRVGISDQLKVLDVIESSLDSLGPDFHLLSEINQPETKEIPDILNGCSEFVEFSFKRNVLKQNELREGEPPNSIKMVDIKCIEISTVNLAEESFYHVVVVNKKGDPRFFEVGNTEDSQKAKEIFDEKMMVLDEVLHEVAF